MTASLLVDPDTVKITNRAASMALDHRIGVDTVVELIDYPEHVVTDPRNPERATHWVGNRVAKIATDFEGMRVVHEIRDAKPTDHKPSETVQVAHEPQR